MPLPDPPDPHRFSNFTPHDVRPTQEQMDQIVSEICTTGKSTAWIGELRFSDSPQVWDLLMKVGDHYTRATKCDPTLSGCIQALCGIYERTRQGYIGEYLQQKFSVWDTGASRLILNHYPFAAEIVPQLRDALSSPDWNMRMNAVVRVRDSREIWDQMKADIYGRLAVEQDERMRGLLQEAKEAIESPR